MPGIIRILMLLIIGLTFTESKLLKIICGSVLGVYTLCILVILLIGRVDYDTLIIPGLGFVFYVFASDINKMFKGWP